MPLRSKNDTFTFKVGSQSRRGKILNSNDTGRGCAPSGYLTTTGTAYRIPDSDRVRNSDTWSGDRLRHGIYFAYFTFLNISMDYVIFHVKLTRQSV